MMIRSCSGLTFMTVLSTPTRLPGLRVLNVVFGPGWQSALQTVSTRYGQLLIMRTDLASVNGRFQGSKALRFLGSGFKRSGFAGLVREPDARTGNLGTRNPGTGNLRYADFLILYSDIFLDSVFLCSPVILAAFETL